MALLLAGRADAQPSGDGTPGSQAPLAVVVNPMDGAVVGDRIRVQVRVHSPLGVAAVSTVTVAVSGEGGVTLPLSLNARYDLGAERGIFDAIAALGPGSHTLVATVTDALGRTTVSETVTVSVGAGRGDGNLLVTDNSSQLCTACHAVADHGSEAVGRAYGAWTTTCRECHTPHSTTNVSLVREEIQPPWVAGAERPAPRKVRFSRRDGYSAVDGAASPALATFANADATGPCQVCHTRTARWRAGGPPDLGHRGDCGFCHRHRGGFRSACTDCHPAVPPATGAHAAHHGASAPEPPFPSDPRALGCGSCHSTDPLRHGDGVLTVELDGALVLPGGTRTAGAYRVGTGAATTCLVACHFPLGAPTPAAPIAWTATGPLPCTSCHARIDPVGAPSTPRAGPSLHDPVFSEARPASGEPTTCHSCHDPGAHDATHLTGDPGLLASASVDATCIACHAPPAGPAAGPQGQVLHAGANGATSRTPPILPGWSAVTVDAATGDFHGGRRGTCYDATNGPSPCAPGVVPTGYGGTLKPPYARGQPGLPCATCHAGHGSANAFLLAPVVNGTAIPPGSIDRTGAGAERLCEACHEGGRHDRCRACHTDAYTCDVNAQCWMDPAANHVDPAPAGSACFFCHGHEGISKWTQPGPDMNFPWDASCAHCHSSLIDHGSTPPLTVPPLFAAPALTAGAPQVSGVTGSGATITWQTDLRSTSWVEYGIGLPGYVAGSDAETTAHAVTLTGLAPGTTWVWRIRSVDAYRNVLATSAATFTTTPAGGVPFPDVVAVGWTGVPSPQTTMVVNLTWFPVAAADGHPVEYRVQLASDPDFATLSNGAPADSGWIAGTPTTSGGKAARSFGATLTNLPIDQCTPDVPFNRYYWRVKARDALTGIESDWSAVDGFNATSYDPVGC